VGENAHKRDAIVKPLRPQR